MDRPNPQATADRIKNRPYLTGTIRRVSTNETRNIDSRWTGRQTRMCQRIMGCNPNDLLATGTSIVDAKLQISANTFIAFWALAGGEDRFDPAEFEHDLDLREDQVLAEFVPELELHTPEGGDDVDPTGTPGSDG